MHINILYEILLLGVPENTAGGRCVKDRGDLTSSAETAQLNITSHTLSVVTLFIAFLNLSHRP